MLFDFSKEYILENGKVRLEPLKEQHVLPLKDIAEEEGLWTYFLGRSNGMANFESYVLDAIAYRKKGLEYPFVVFDKQKNKFAGSTRFFDYSSDLKTIRLGYTWYGTNFRGTGLNKNCKYLLFDFALHQLNLERVGLGAHEENKVSIAAMKSVGGEQEGQIKNLFPSIHGTGRADAVLFGILKEDWESFKKLALKNKL